MLKTNWAKITITFLLCIIIAIWFVYSRYVFLDGNGVIVKRCNRITGNCSLMIAR